MDYKAVAKSLNVGLQGLIEVADALALHINQTGPVHPDLLEAIEDAKKVSAMAQDLLGHQTPMHTGRSSRDLQ